MKFVSEASSRLFAMEAGGLCDGELRVVGFRGHEAVSRPYRWDVVVELEGIDFEALDVAVLGQPACLDFTLAESVPRLVHGVVSALRRVEASQDGALQRARLRLVPRLALLSRNRVSRIFQDMTVPDIVQEVLSDAGIGVELRLQKRYAPRVYCVQYQESDLEFVSRVLAEEGIFYFFQQPRVRLSSPEAAAVVREMAEAVGSAVVDLGEVVVLADGAGLCPPIARPQFADEAPTTPGAVPPLTFHPGEGAVPAEHHVSQLARERSVRPQAVLIRDFDFRRPSLDLSASRSTVAVPPSSGGLHGRDFVEVLGDAIHRTSRAPAAMPVPSLGLDPRRMTVYEHHGEDEDPEVSRAAANVRFEQVRRRAITTAGASWCRRLSAGHRFRLRGHPSAEFNGEYTAVEVHHVGRTGSTKRTRGEQPAYQNSFTCVPAWAPFRPRPVARVHRQVLETARVVGPPGEEIYTDEHGRIKVQFHWDLTGSHDERSSCWVRVNQAWAGPMWGTQFIPRVGMEVIVSFVGGDQDRPVVLGCLYTGENTPTFTVPGDRTRSGVRTQSSPGGGGFNELSFEDAKGAEQVYLHAERNLDEVVRNDHSVHVVQDDATTVGRHQTLSVVGNRKEEVHGDRMLHVKQEHREINDGPVNVTIRGPEHRWNLDQVEHRIEGRARYIHTTAVDEDFEDERTVRAKGCVTTLVGAVDEERHWGLHVEGTSEHYASKGHELRSDEAIVLRCGTSSVVISPNAIDFSADTLTLRSGDTVFTVEGKTITARAKETITLEGQQKARLLAPEVSLTKAESLPGAERPPPPTRILLTDTDGQPLPGRRYRVKQADGTVHAGFLDAEGAATIPGDQGGQVEFPEFDEASS